MKMREFTLYARQRGIGFSTRWADFYHHGHHWVYKIFAVTVAQAWRAAVHGHFAAGPRRTGIRRIQYAYWLDGRTMPEPGDVALAPYLLEERSDLETMEANNGPA